MAALIDTSWSSLVAILLATLFVASQIHASRRRAKMPPGPKGLPLVGNIFQMPITSQWLQTQKFAQWKEQFGSIYSLNLVGQPMIVLNSAEVCADLLDKRAKTFSNRGRFIVAGQYMTGGLHIALMDYGDLWRRCRKVAHEGLNVRVVPSYGSIQEQESAILVRSIIDKPAGWEEHLRRATASMTRTLVYGTSPISTSDDPVVRTITDSTHVLTSSVIPGAHLVDIFPVLDKVPAAFAKWKRVATAYFDETSAAFHGFLGDAREAYRMGHSAERPSIAQNMLTNQERHGMSDNQINWLAAGLFSGGSDTTASTLTTFFLAMVHYPEVQARAQREIDEVVGRDRLPTVADDLPYVACIVQELLRWRPIAPLGIPRYCTEDNWYNGYLIPKGAFVMFNVWALNRDPDIYPDYDEFRPERYMSTGDDGKAQGRAHHSYGLGRRICPGMHLANQGLFIQIATTLWALSIKPSGHVPSKMDFIDAGVTVKPAPFECTFVERSNDTTLGRQLLARGVEGR